MELYTLQINVNGQTLTLHEDLDIFSGDSGIDYVQFTFEDDRWDTMTDKFAVFNRYGGQSYKVALDGDSKALVPAEVMQKKGYIYIGLFGTDGNVVQTSSVLQFQLGEGAISEGSLTPTGDIYEQWIEDLNAYHQAVSDLAEIQSEITTAQGQVADLTDTLSTMSGTVSGLEGRISSAENHITTAEGNIATLQGNVTSLQGSVTTLQGNVTTIQSSVGTLQGQVTTLQGSVGTLQSDVSTLQSDVADLRTDLDGLTADIGTMQSDVADLQTDIEQLQATLDEYGFVSDAVVDGQSLKDTNNIVDLSFAVVQDTASGEIASFSDGSANPMTKCLVNLEPIQSGTGTPSPDNVRPISGHDSVGVSVTGKNLFGGLPFANGIKSAIMQAVLDTSAGTISYASGYAGTDTNFTSGIPFKANTQYTLILRFSNTKARTNMRIAYTDGTQSIITTTATGLQTVVFTSTANKTIDFIGGVNSDGTSVFYYDECGIFEGTLTADDFEPYTSTTYTDPLPQTVYGGTVDLVDGTLTVTKGYIASYSGQTINEPWISDRDEYVSGTTPSTGAEVCYELATPQTYQLTPMQVRSLLHDNNVWSENGTIEVTYIANLKDYIEKVVS